MKILLFGKTGQVGWELQRSLAPLGELIALDRHGADGLCGDLAKPERIAETVRRLAPDVIVNAAAYTAVDKAESETALAQTINAEAPAAMAREAERLGAWLVHSSTDYVLDGSGERPWHEDDRCAPPNAYGLSKQAGEQAVKACERHLVLRTSWVYAARGANFLRTMLRLAGERDTLRVINDQYGAPTGAELIADVTAYALRQAIRQPELAGLYHLAAAGTTNWHAYACHLIAGAQARGLPLRATVEQIEAIATSAYPTPARRSANSRLACGKLQTSFDLNLPDWRLGVDRVLDELAATAPDGGSRK